MPQYHRFYNYRPSWGRTIPDRPSRGRTVPDRPSRGRTIPDRPSRGRTIPDRPQGGGAQYLPSSTDKRSNIDREIEREERRRSARIASLQSHYTHFIRLDYALELHSTSFSLSDIKLPKSFEAAVRTPQSSEWQSAVDSELKGLEDTGCYEKTRLPPNTKAIFAQWVLTVKTDSFSNIIEYKARCTCRGDMIPAKMNSYTSSPVASWTGIRLFLALTTLYRLTPYSSTLT